MSLFSTVDLHREDAIIPIPEPEPLPGPQPRIVRGHIWCPWNRDPTLTDLQRTMIKNMILWGMFGSCISLALIYAGARPDSYHAISAVGGSVMILSFTVMIFAEYLPKIFHELNERTSSEHSQLITP